MTMKYYCIHSRSLRIFLFITALLFNLFQVAEPLAKLNAPYSAIYIIFMEPSKELAEPLRSAEPRLKNTALQYPPLNSYDHFGPT